MVTATVRRVGNGLVVTLPKDEAERLGVGEGDLVSVGAAPEPGAEADRIAALAARLRGG